MIHEELAGDVDELDGISKEVAAIVIRLNSGYKL